MSKHREPIHLYLDLLKRTLSFSLWDEPPTPLLNLPWARSRFVRTFFGMVSTLLGAFRLEVGYRLPVTEEQRLTGAIWPGYAHTMIGLKRLDNLQFAVETVLSEGIPGDLIETGVWRGGACILMRAVLAAHSVTDRRVFVADSFAGLPKPDAGRYRPDQGDQHFTHSFLAVTQEEVANNFRKFGLLDDQVVFLKGWFKNTLPTAPIERLAVLRLDGDMYESTIQALDSLYPKLATGGFCIVDDYVLDNCRQAIQDFRKTHGITAEMKEIDFTGRYWRKE